MGKGYLHRLLAVLLATTLVGCFRVSKPDRFYLLRARAEGPAGPATGGPLIGLEPVRIPPYLDRPQIVTALSEQEYQLSDRHRWAERLDVSIARVMAENLSNLLPAAQVVIYPWPREPKPEFQVAIGIREFHIDPEGQARLAALWTLRFARAPSVSRKFSCRLPASKVDYARMVEAESQCLARLSRDIAAAIRHAPGSGAPE
ncbi:PqiC family protein [Candidatus Methylocalor cossyra]|uniref:Membrane integrity-associated transporter subunit PqiC n=1 Tax=Candidatus Methylocalor cossyra TaxID=3108543 RepID=A0ABM9NET0_9GAMM